MYDDTFTTKFSRAKVSKMRTQAVETTLIFFNQFVVFLICEGHS